MIFTWFEKGSPLWSYSIGDIFNIFAAVKRVKETCWNLYEQDSWGILNTRTRIRGFFKKAINKLLVTISKKITYFTLILKKVTLLIIIVFSKTLWFGIFLKGRLQIRVKGIKRDKQREDREKEGQSSRRCHFSLSLRLRMSSIHGFTAVKAPPSMSSSSWMCKAFSTAPSALLEELCQTTLHSRGYWVKPVWTFASWWLWWAQKSFQFNFS